MNGHWDTDFDYYKVDGKAVPGMLADPYEDFPLVPLGNPEGEDDGPHGV